MPSFRKFFDPLDRLPDFVPELLSQVYPLRVVVTNRVFQLALSGH